MQTYLAGLTAIHDGGPNYRDRNRRVGFDDSDREYPHAEHPVIRTHPRTGRKGIFVNSVFTTELRGVPKDEGEAILAFLYAHIAKPQVPMPVPLARKLDRDVGQPLRSAPRHVGLLPRSPLRLSRHGGWRPTVLTLVGWVARPRLPDHRRGH